MTSARHLLGAALLALSIIFGAWDGGVGSGKLLVSIVLFIVGVCHMDVFGERGQLRD